MLKTFSVLRLQTSPQHGLDRGKDPSSANKTKRRLVLMIGLGGLAALPVFGAGLNDTGITTCADMTSMELDCDSSNVLPNQDAFFGLDTLEAGKKGFSFVKIGNNRLELDSEGLFVVSCGI